MADLSLVERANYGRTHEQVYEDNVRTSDKILQALLGGGEPAGVLAKTLPHLKLFPKKVSQDATVYAVFAIQ